MKPVAFALAFVTIAVSTATISCHRSKAYESEVEITRMSSVTKDAAGKVLTSDVEFSYTDCPGSQVETLRGDAKFSECIARYKVGQKVKVKLDHQWPDDHYVWTVNKVGDCDRTVDPADEASFAVLRDCEDWEVTGARVGFRCSLKAESKLVDKCPWFRRH
jgi:hypothetical protein